MTVFTYMGQAADGTYPEAGAAIRYRCELCRQMCESTQPKPGRMCIYCSACAKKINEVMDGDGDAD